MKIRIGTRGSRLAVIQAEMVENAVISAFPEAETELVRISTKGDRVTDRPIDRIGGRGVFIGEIEAALTAGEIDIAVHSAKDMAISLAAGTVIGAVLPRACPLDTLVIRRDLAEKLSADPLAEYRVGTSSNRRKNAASRLLPNSVFADIRGNVDTRLQKLHDGEYDCILLAQAGLSRLGMDADPRFVYRQLAPEESLPAPCQGIIAVQSREGKFAEILRKINDPDTMLCFETEREVLRLLNAGCSTPVGALAEVSGGQIRLSVTLDQRKIASGSAPIQERSALAERLVREL
ncbi:MAG: hydroxymethylbilane synthase [Ruminococcus sp.]|nr:hydroxymethylbilane synthase [Ruminococcus sp.]